MVRPTTNHQTNHRRTISVRLVRRWIAISERFLSQRKQLGDGLLSEKVISLPAGMTLGKYEIQTVSDQSVANTQFVRGIVQIHHRQSQDFVIDARIKRGELENHSSVESDGSPDGYQRRTIDEPSDEQSWFAAMSESEREIG